jgi:transcriptional regulator with XRE-family HTH domain
MSGIKIIRNYFGLTQQQLAVFLNVSSSMLSMALSKTITTKQQKTTAPGLI